MTEKDYSQTEIDNVLDELITLHFSKLKPTEVYFISRLVGREISQEERNALMKLYDGVRDMPGE